MADLLFILFGFSYFACVESASESALRVWLNPNLSNRRSAVQWYFPLSWVFSDLWINLSLDQPVYPYLYQFICPFISLYLSTADRIALVFSCSKLIVVVFAVYQRVADDAREEDDDVERDQDHLERVDGHPTPEIFLGKLLCCCCCYCYVVVAQEDLAPRKMY